MKVRIYIREKTTYGKEFEILVWVAINGHTC